MSEKRDIDKAFKIIGPTAEDLEIGRKNYELAMEDRRRSCLSRWFPLIENLVPVPKTIIVPAEIELFSLWDGIEPAGYDGFVQCVADAAMYIGLPTFLRTGLTSGKHYWKNMCYLTDLRKLKGHIFELAEFSGMVDLPIDTWVIREMLPVVAPFTAFSGEMPIVAERRYFVRDGKVQCHHPYWPEHSIDGQNPSRDDWQVCLAELNTEYDAEIAELTNLTEIVGHAVGGFWSVDWLFTKNGWYLTDMGTGEQSFHWPGCKENL